MTATVDRSAMAGGVQGLWRREIYYYPETRSRVWYLAIVVAATIVLYYELYIAGAVSPTIISSFGMSFPFYVYISVVGNAVGAFGSLAAGLGDRWGRANMVAYGLLITGLLVLFGIPNVSSEWAYAVLFCLVGMVEGVILVATPALVRKPFMVAGALGAIVFMIIFLNLGAATSYSTFVVVISLLAVFLAIAYAPWMASFTETVEKHNPALIATGLAVWGWIIRVVIALSVLILPSVVSSMTPLVTYGTQAAQITAQYPQQVQTIGVVPAATLVTLQADPANTTALGTATKDIVATLHVSRTEALARLLALNDLPAKDKAFLGLHGTAVADAAASAPGQWEDWWWVCVGGMIVFIPFILVMAGRWSPRAARRDADEHEARLQEELAALQ